MQYSCNEKLRSCIIRHFVSNVRCLKINFIRTHLKPALGWSLYLASLDKIKQFGNSARTVECSRKLTASALLFYKFVMLLIAWLVVELERLSPSPKENSKLEESRTDFTKLIIYFKTSADRLHFF